VSCTPSTTLLDALRGAADGRDFDVVSEWLGYLPFGQYIWIEVDGVTISDGWPPWDSADIQRLVADGSLVELERRVTSGDGLDTRTTYRLAR
jgi:hypothetical protein